MPFAEVQLTPGVDVESSLAGNPSGIQESNFVRWRAKLPEKRGGCTLYIPTLLNGVPVSLKPWGDFQGDNFLGIATTTTVYKYNPASSSVIQNISPKVAISPLASPTFTTTLGSRQISITDATAPALTQFDSVQFITPITLENTGLILNGTYPIISATPLSTTYTIEVPYESQATEVGISATLPQFDSVLGVSQITVTFPIQYQFDSLSVGDRIGFYMSDANPPQALTTVGGIPIEGSYLVSQISSATQFLFQAQYVATSTQNVTMNGGYVYLKYWITDPPGAAP